MISRPWKVTRPKFPGSRDGFLLALFIHRTMGAAMEKAEHSSRRHLVEAGALPVPPRPTAGLGLGGGHAHHGTKAPRRGAVSHIPGISVSPGSGRTLPDAMRASLHGMELVNAGTHRALAAEQAERALDFDPLATDPQRVWTALLTLLFAGDLATVEARCELLMRDSRWAGSPCHQNVLILLRARSSLLSGDAGRAVRVLEAALARKASTLPVPLTVAWLIEALVHTGETGRAHALLLRHELAGQLRTDLPDRAHVLAARGALHMGTGQFRHSLEDYTDCGRVLRGARVLNPAVIPWRSKAALGALAVHKHDLALGLAEDELIAARKWGSPRCVGTALHAVAVCRGDESSVPLLDEAVQLLSLGHAGTELMQALCDLGALQIERKELTEGRSRLKAAGEVARECRNGFWARQVGSALQRMGSSGAHHSLTRQEKKIAQLARAGYSNRQIAETLFLTVRTVEFHLSSVYRKFAISGRKELTTAL
jgi:DNA-binding CsgD family transcriptional regulator